MAEESSFESNPYAQPRAPVDVVPEDHRDPNVQVIGDVPVTAASLKDLFFAPTRFFSAGLALDRQPAYGIAIAFLAVAAAIDRIEQQSLKAEMGRPNPMADLVNGSWPAYWGVAAISALIGAWFYWQIGGWWYRKRLNWSGAAVSEPHVPRVVFVWVTLVAAAPSVLEQVLETLFAPTKAEVDLALLEVMPLFFLFWSIVTSYRAVLTAFPDASRGRLRLWFAILPALVYLFAFGAITTAFALLGGGGAGVE